MDTEQKMQEFNIRLQKVEERLTKLESSAKEKPDSVSPQKILSIKEFILEKQPVGDAEKTIVVGCYLENQEKMECFNRKDLDEGFRRAKEKTPNLDRAIGQNIKEGLMMEAKEKKNGKKAWLLTNKGEKLVEIGFRPPKAD